MVSKYNFFNTRIFFTNEKTHLYLPVKAHTRTMCSSLNFTRIVQFRKLKKKMDIIIEE